MKYYNGLYAEGQLGEELTTSQLATILFSCHNCGGEIKEYLYSRGDVHIDIDSARCHCCGQLHMIYTHEGCILLIDATNDDEPWQYETAHMRSSARPAGVSWCVECQDKKSWYRGCDQGHVPRPDDEVPF